MMQCKECKRVRREEGLIYTHDTLELYCTDCLSTGIPYSEFNQFLEGSIPDIVKLTGSPISTRLEQDDIIYLMKYAHSRGTRTISSTFQAMVQELKEKHVDLDNEKLLDSPFSGYVSTKKRKDVVPSFLKRKDSFKPEEIKIEQPKVEDKKDQDDEDVFVL